MSRTEWNISESVLGRSIFGPLGGIVEIGAVSATGTWSLSGASVASFVSAHQSDVSRLLEVVREIGDFDGPTMGIFDELGYLRDHPVQVPSLLMWSSLYEDMSPQLEAPASVRRMCRTGADLQLTRFLQELVNAAIARGPGEDRGTALIAEAVRIGAGLVAGALDEGPGTAARTVFRMWRVGFLADLLLPTSPAQPQARTRFRAYGHALEELLSGPAAR
ncbi:MULTISPECIES: hypothetical protein [unclassified Streptomyces]|uniref:hypothetical protein n=1 Tax=unclassified Streptomyces TaxID=2593676 RepID=UPI0033EC79A7